MVSSQKVDHESGHWAGMWNAHDDRHWHGTTVIEVSNDQHVASFRILGVEGCIKNDKLMGPPILSQIDEMIAVSFHG